LIFLSAVESYNYVAFTMKSKMPIIKDNNALYIICYDCEPEFWGKLNVISNNSAEREDICKVRYDDVVKQIQEELKN
jgi:hypothetical protein